MSDGGFDPTKKGTATLSNSERTATAVDFGDRAVIGQKRRGWSLGKGKFYFEMRRDTVGADGALYGICSTDYVVGVSGNVARYYSADGKFYVGAAAPVIGASTAAGDVISFAVDFTNLLIWCRVNSGLWNGSGTGNPATAVGGLPFGTDQEHMVFCSVDALEACTIRASSPVYTLTPPVGFGEWNSPVLAAPATNIITVNQGTPLVGFGIKVLPTGTSATISVGTVGVFLGLIVQATGTTATASLNSVTVNFGFTILVSSLTATASVNSVIVTTKANVFAAGTPMAISVGGVSVFAGGNVGVGLNGNLLTASVGTPSFKLDYKMLVSGLTSTLSVNSATVVFVKFALVDGFDLTSEIGYVGAISVNKIAVAGQSCGAQVGSVDVSAGTSFEVAGFGLTAGTSSVSLFVTSVIMVTCEPMVSRTTAPIVRMWAQPLSEFALEKWTPVQRSDGRMLG